MVAWSLAARSQSRLGGSAIVALNCPMPLRAIFRPVPALPGLQHTAMQPGCGYPYGHFSLSKRNSRNGDVWESGGEQCRQLAKNGQSAQPDNQHDRDQGKYGCDPHESPVLTLKHLRNDAEIAG